jgi:hypothetical protein
MTSEEQLRARLRKIEALFAGATTAGERVAGALTPIMARLAEAQLTARSVELQFSLADPWSRQLFLALLGVTVCARIATHARAGPRSCSRRGRASCLCPMNRGRLGTRALNLDPSAGAQLDGRPRRRAVRLKLRDWRMQSQALT